MFWLFTDAVFLTAGMLDDVERHIGRYRLRPERVAECVGRQAGQAPALRLAEVGFLLEQL